ncbi:4936_t:CDS:2 [Cetraspora pellucida]|uniref:4936_t:CDS:1 n=1 Tax=Cetraspora pellucida TaxID=1433469 RepID=A0A9N9EN68_9GLOM|nr:4936_t:CDS:2 [Cetraspora pellucida]
MNGTYLILFVFKLQLFILTLALVFKETVEIFVEAYFIIKEFETPNNDLLNNWNIYCGLEEELDDNLDLNQYWKEKSRELPHLSKIALSYIWLSVSGIDVEPPVRDYLSSVDDDGGKICKLCKQEFGSLTAISTINQHFQNFHLAEFTKIKQLRSRRLDPYDPNDKYKLLGITTDNAANMLAMGHILRENISNEFGNQTVQHFRCGAHVLNIVVEEGIKLISIEISKAQEFFMKLRNSPSLIHELKKILK